MEILNLQQIIWQALNFLILYFIISKFVVPPTKKFIAEREKQISEGVANAEEVKKQLADAQRSKQAIIDEARAEGKALIEEMRLKSDEISKKMMEEARAEAAAEVKRLVSQAEVDLERRRADMDEKVIALARVIAEKAIAGTVSVDLHHQILKKQLEQMQRSSI